MDYDWEYEDKILEFLKFKILGFNVVSVEFFFKFNLVVVEFVFRKFLNV